MSQDVVIALACLVAACIGWMVREARHPLVVLDEPPELDDFDRALIRAGLAVGSEIPNERGRS